MDSTNANIAIGDFVFTVKNAPWDKIKRSDKSKWVKSDRMGQRDALQFLGPDSDEITLDGAIYSCAGFGDHFSLDRLRRMKDLGKPYTMVDITGQVHGLWVIVSLDDSRSEASKIPFTLKLVRYE